MAFQYKKRTVEAAEARASQQGGGFEGYFKDEYRQYGAKNGDNAIRILPRDASEGADHYGEDVWVHFNVGPDRATIICPNKMANEACPVCEERHRAERRGDDEAAKDLKPSRRVAVWLIDRKDEPAGPELWGMPWTVDRDISKACRDRETGTYSFPEDPQDGYDIFFERSGNPPFVDYGPFQLSRKPNSVPPEILDFISKNPILDCLRIRSYAEIKMLFDGAGASAGSPLPPATVSEAAASTQREPAQEVREAADTRPALRPAEPAAPRESEPAPRPTEPAREPEPVGASAAPAPSGAERAAALRARFAKK